ncbi:hypothetical protein U9M48_016539 [Paspalum notatum var. saurae]|uniref:Uncharacterized protein n=1 Tax=Paspalum notatum var. saurae TaxID=547442 RepID=A0AAQ3WMY0_PASNO
MWHPGACAIRNGVMPSSRRIRTTCRLLRLRARPRPAVASSFSRRRLAGSLHVRRCRDLSETVLKKGTPQELLGIRRFNQGCGTSQRPCALSFTSEVCTLSKNSRFKCNPCSGDDPKLTKTAKSSVEEIRVILG